MRGEKVKCQLLFDKNSSYKRKKNKQNVSSVTMKSRLDNIFIQLNQLILLGKCIKDSSKFEFKPHKETVAVFDLWMLMKQKWNHQKN